MASDLCSKHLKKETR